MLPKAEIKNTTPNSQSRLPDMVCACTKKDTTSSHPTHGRVQKKVTVLPVQKINIKAAFIYNIPWYLVLGGDHRYQIRTHKTFLLE